MVTAFILLLSFSYRAQLHWRWDASAESNHVVLLAGTKQKSWCLRPSLPWWDANRAPLSCQETSGAVQGGLGKHETFRPGCKSAQQQLLRQHLSSFVVVVSSEPSSTGRGWDLGLLGSVSLCKSVGRFPQLAVRVRGSIRTAWL